MILLFKVTQNPQDFSESLVNVVGLVRQAINLKSQSANAKFKFDKVIQILTLVPYTSQFYLRRN